MLLRDRLTGASKGSAFVWYTTRAAGERAILQFNMRRIAEASGDQERPLVVSCRRRRCRRCGCCWSLRLPGWLLAGWVAGRHKAAQPGDRRAAPACLCCPQVRPADDWKLKELQEMEGGAGGAAPGAPGAGLQGAAMAAAQQKMLLGLPQGAAALQLGLPDALQLGQLLPQAGAPPPGLRPKAGLGGLLPGLELQQQQQQQPGQLVYLTPSANGGGMQQGWMPAQTQGYAPGLDGLVAGTAGLGLSDSGAASLAQAHQGLLLDVLGGPAQKLAPGSEGLGQQVLLPGALQAAQQHHQHHQHQHQQPLYVMLQDGQLVQLAQHQHQHQQQHQQQQLSYY